MKKILLITPLLLAMNGFSQNLLITNLGNQSLNQAQSVQVFASNIKVNDNNVNNINKPARARVDANPQINFVQRASPANTTQRRRRRTTPRPATNISNPVQTNIINIENNINDDIQIQGNFTNQSDNNVGNAFGNESMIEQIASVNIPAIQLGSGSMNLNLDLNLPTLKMPSIKFASRKTVSSSKHKNYSFKKKLAKLNRNLSGKLSFNKKLKIKVDNCFKW